MEYSSSSWKHKLRKAYYSILPRGMYLRYMPMVLQLFNKKRRGCSYRFVAGDKGEVLLLSDKTSFSFIGARRIKRYVYARGLERRQAAMQKKYCKEGSTIEAGDVVVEVGANVGEFTRMAAAIASRVYAFEPDPRCFACLQKNVSEMPNVNVFPIALSDVVSELVFYLASEDADSSLIPPKVYSESISVPAMRLDKWMEEQGMDKIDFLKVEAEGAEMEVLQGLGESINQVRKISVDGGPERFGEPTAPQVEQYLQMKGFKTRLMDYHVYAWK
jgi:FkbM family methyltransferase